MPSHAYVTVKLRCPLCSQEFVADEVHGSRATGRDTDFRPLYDGADPGLSHVHSCPGCRYSGYREAFDTEPSDEDALLEPAEEDRSGLARPFVTAPEDPDVSDLRRYARSGELWKNLVPASKDPFGAIRWLLAARVHEFCRESDPLGVAHYYLRAAWCARLAEDRKMEREALRGALIRVAGVLEGEKETTSALRVKLAYLAGELSRRVGNFAPALEYFAQVEALADADEEEGALLVALARRQARLAGVKSSVNAVIPEEMISGRRRNKVSSADEAEDLPGDDPDDDDDDDIPDGHGELN